MNAHNPPSGPSDAQAHGVDLSNESVAGEEDPGAALDLPKGAGPSIATGSPDATAAAAPAPFAGGADRHPGEEAPAGTPGTAPGICRDCGGSGRLQDAACRACGGTGQVTVGLGGG